MQVSSGAFGTSRWHFSWRLLMQAVAAAVLAGGWLSSAAAAEAAQPEAKDEEVLDEVAVTGSRITRRDTVSNSPLVTVERQELNDSTYTSIEQVLNDMPEFMAGGPGVSSASVTSLTEANNLSGGQGAGTMFNQAMLPDNGRIGQSLPGVATVNLRGLGVNRNLVLVDGHRGVPSTANGVMDLNNIPQAAIASVEVISGGASAVYGADALAGVTNMKLQQSFEGLRLGVRSGINEVGDGEEYQVSTLMGTKFAGKGSALLALEYNKRDSAYWEERDFFREAMDSPLSGAGNYLFHWYPGYGAGAIASGLGATTTCAIAGTGCVTTSAALGAGGGATQVGQYNLWGGNAPTRNAVNSVFGDRNCLTAADPNCVSVTGGGLGFGFNPDGTLFTRVSSTGTGAATIHYGPQGYLGQTAGTKENPDEITCAFSPNTGRSALAAFPNAPCTPTLNRVDHGRWLTSPRTSYSMYGRADYDFNDRISAYTSLMMTSTSTSTRREPAPSVIGSQWTVPIPYSGSPTAIYLPSIAQARVGAVNVGDTLPEYRAGGTRGTNCPAVGGCTMAQAFPVSPELATLLNSRPDVAYGTTGANATNPWRGLSACQQRAVDPNGAQTAAASGVRYSTRVDPLTGQPYYLCGPNSSWNLGQTLDFLPPRGTTNQTRNWQLTAGLKGDVGLSDWTWDLYMSRGNSNTSTEYNGFVSFANYFKIMTAPNYGQGFSEESTGSKLLRCTSGISPFTNVPVSQDCADAITSDQMDRNSMTQSVYELNLQGHVVNLPGGEVRAAIGAGTRKNRFAFTPDAQRERDYVIDSSPGQFGISALDESVSVDEVYGELIVPLLRDLPGAKSVELELGGRWSDYSTGQGVPTWKTLLSWSPVEWVRLRGGYNRAERAPNIAELYNKPSTSSQLSSAAVDLCTTNIQTTFPGVSNATDNPNRAQLVALCAAQIDAWGGAGASTFHANILLPGGSGTYTAAADGAGGGAQLITGNADLKSEKGQTWTAGFVINSPFQQPLLERLSATVDWYEARIDGPIDARSTQAVVNACFNVDGSNPTYSLNDPGGYCALIERNPISGGLLRISTPFDNYSKIITRGVDVSLRWSAALSDMGMAGLPGRVSVNTSSNFLLDQKQPLTAGGAVVDRAGLDGASKTRVLTNFGYSLETLRASLTWDYRRGTHATNAVTRLADPNFAGYSSVSLFNATVGKRFGSANVSFSISNLLDTEPNRGGYNWLDPTQGFGTFDPNGDLVGRRYSLNLSLDL
jgi:outer membrane receptor protein involved in Fe transport